ncbi:calcium/proton exchanger [bacterium]|nr:calcium/proton exchanger [bacterium]
MLSSLLVFVPISLFLKSTSPESALLFVTSCIAIIPLAGWMGRATEQIAHRAGEGIGGILNATFGNAAELIIALIALQNGLHEVVKASLTGSIIGNILLVLGASFFAGGLFHREQKFNQTAASALSTMLLLSSIALIVPTSFHYLVPNPESRSEQNLSLEISLVLMATYLAGLLFSLKTHKNLFVGEDKAEELEDGHLWSMKKSLIILLIATGLIAWMSELLVHSVEHAAHALGMSQIFIGVIVVAIVGNAAEHSTAILVAMKNRMDLSIGIAVGSSIQIALFVAPVLIFASHFIGPKPLDLVFTPAEVLAVFLSTLIATQISSDGKSNWFEGFQLLSVYVILGMLFFFL